MRAHGVKQKPPACARARVRVPIMNMYGSFCGRYVRVLFAPRDSMCACEIKGCRPPPVLSSSPSISHTCIFSLSLSLSRVRSFFCPLFISAYVDYDRVLHLVLRLLLLCVSFISGCDSNLRRRINVFSGILYAIESAVGQHNSRA